MHVTKDFEHANTKYDNVPWRTVARPDLHIPADADASRGLETLTLSRCSPHRFWPDLIVSRVMAIEYCKLTRRLQAT